MRLYNFGIIRRTLYNFSIASYTKPAPELQHDVEVILELFPIPDSGKVGPIYQNTTAEPADSISCKSDSQVIVYEATTCVFPQHKHPAIPSNKTLRRRL